MRKHAVIVGSGPNGLAAGIVLARAGLAVTVLEGAESIGGGARTEELTLPGYLHDVCSAFHPLAVASPFFASVPLADFGLRWAVPEVQVAHPLDDGTAAAYRSLDRTVDELGTDGPAWRRLVGWPAAHWDRLAADLLGPLLRRPSHPVAMARFGAAGVLPATSLLQRAFAGEAARALFAGMAAHSVLPLQRPLSASFGLLLGALAHVGGWPVAVGGSGAITSALARYLQSMGGEVLTNHPVDSPADLPPAEAVLFDTTPGAVARIYGDTLPARAARRLRRFRHGPGVFKLDLAVSQPIPWQAGACRAAGTVHVGGSWEEIATAEAAVWKGTHPERPFVLVGQQSIVDPTRTPDEGHTVWAYCHVPAGSATDMTEPILAQIERFAPGFGATILRTHATGPAGLEAANPNYVGGDISGGAHDRLQLIARGGLRPYRTGLPGVYLCSASTPPGAGVHGMCGLHAARTVLADLHIDA